MSSQIDLQKDMIVKNKKELVILYSIVVTFLILSFIYMVYSGITQFKYLKYDDNPVSLNLMRIFVFLVPILLLVSFSLSSKMLSMYISEEESNNEDKLFLISSKMYNIISLFVLIFVIIFMDAYYTTNGLRRNKNNDHFYEFFIVDAMIMFSIIISGISMLK